MILIEEGDFQLGCDSCETSKPEKKVYLDSFFIDQFEISVIDYKKCVESKKCSEPDTYYCNTPQNNWLHKEERGDHPINCVNWQQAYDYCKAQNKRLPTEAEWEKAARGPTGNIYPWGMNWPNLEGVSGEYGNFNDESYKILESNLSLWSGLKNYNDGWPATSPRGLFEKDKSEYGVYDLMGNVIEFTDDWYSNDYNQKAKNKNPSGPKTGQEKTIKGGSYLSGKNTDMHLSFRRSTYQNTAIEHIGFRCAKSLKK